MANSAIENGSLLTPKAVLDLLDPYRGTIFTGEESWRRWQPSSRQIFDKPLLRLWDHRSGSQPDWDGCMRSRAEPEHLHTYESRKESLTVHVDHGKWTPTPYISFTTRPTEIANLASLRDGTKHRGPHTLTVVDPDQRIRDGLPILHVLDEMIHYKIADPYGKSYAYYRDHYVCLWEVTEREIVRHWPWDELVNNDNWYEEVVMPAFRKHRGKATEAMSLSDQMAKLSLTTRLPDPTNLYIQPRIFNEPVDSSDQPYHQFDDECCQYYEEDDSYYETYGGIEEDDGSDTDDEVEEANANDDMIKIIEGN